ncbi:MAG: hypothetical protein ACLU4N_13665 [Butyricimonas faecihominis]
MAATIKDQGFVRLWKSNYDPYQAITTYEYLTGERYHYAVGRS